MAMPARPSALPKALEEMRRQLRRNPGLNRSGFAGASNEGSVLPLLQNIWKRARSSMRH